MIMSFNLLEVTMTMIMSCLRNELLNRTPVQVQVNIWKSKI